MPLAAVIPSSGNVWINAFDNSQGMGKEGVWVFNRGAVSLFGPDWANERTRHRCQ